MPKPIKKRVVKKTEPEEELKEGLEKIKHNIKEKGQELKRIIIVSVIIIIVIVGLVGYNLYSKSRASRFFYEGYSALFLERGISTPDRYRAGLEALKKSYDSKPDPLTLLYMADGYLKMGSLEEALKILQEFKMKYSNNRYLMPLCYQRMAVVYKKKGLNEEALKVYDELYKNGYTLRDLALYESARIYREIKDLKEAEKRIELLRKEFPQSPYLSMLKAE